MKAHMIVLCLATVISSGCGSPTGRDSEAGKENAAGTPRGSAKNAGVELPTEFPSDIPIYPGSKPTTVLDNAEGTMVSFETDATVPEVTSYYEEQLKAHGWSNPAGSFKSAESALFQSKKENRSIMIGISKEKNATLISMALQGNPDQ
ncbi:MAG TPA: hypothetical protein QF564_03290 [Pirellulaceae bacterium]|nr:hypothetical protein [Pirellulaceae bacterium]